MKLKNTTIYSDETLKKLIYMCAKKLRGGRKLTKDLSVVIKSNLQGFSVSGNAYMSKVYHPDIHFPDNGHRDYGYLIHLKIPNKLQRYLVSGEQSNPNDTKRDIASVIMHELMHCQGHNHWKINKLEKKYDYSFVDTFDFIPKLMNTKIVAKRDLKKERYEKAIKMVKVYQTKLKRDTTLLKKWQRKVKYYEK
jgi:hypothetical protein